MKDKFLIKYTKVVNEEVTFKQYISVKLQKLRKEKGFTQEEFANEVGLSRASIVNIEKGRQQITMKGLFLICRTLDVKSSDILPF